MTFMGIVGAVSLNPDSGALPGGAAVQGFANGLGFYALIGCLIAIVLGAAAWGLGSLGAGNMRAQSGGKTAVGVGVVGAFLIGAAAALVQFFWSSETTI